jgi:hypothetical protein
MKNKIIYVYVICCLGCANPIVPTGGPKDNEPPKIVTFSPSCNSTNIKPHQIKFTFNENIQVNNLTDELILSPKYTELIKTDINKRTITINLDTNKLHDNVTYSLTLQQAVADLNEGNKGKYKPYLFSTGLKIDTFNLYCKLKTINDEALKKPKYLLTDIDKADPIYVGRLDGQNILFSGLNEKKKKIMIYDDLNNNDTLDEFESRGYTYAQITDTALLQVYPNKIIKIQLGKIDSTLYKLYGFTKTSIDYQIKPILHNTDYIFNDTIYCGPNTLQDIKNFNLNKLYQISNKADKTMQFSKKMFRLSSFSQDSLLKLYYEASEPITNCKFYDNNKKELFYTSDNINIKNISVQPNQKFIISSTFKDSISISESTLQETYFNNTVNERIVLIVKNTNTLETTSIIIPAKDTYKLFLVQGVYELQYWADTNLDYHLTAPDINFSRTGEPVVSNKKIKINSNLVFHVDLTFNNNGE